MSAVSGSSVSGSAAAVDGPNGSRVGLSPQTPVTWSVQHKMRTSPAVPGPFRVYEPARVPRIRAAAQREAPFVLVYLSSRTLRP
jgi:hypothetical protein